MMNSLRCVVLVREYDLLAVRRNLDERGFDLGSVVSASLENIRINTHGVACECNQVQGDRPKLVQRSRDVSLLPLCKAIVLVYELGDAVVAKGFPQFDCCALCSEYRISAQVPDRDVPDDPASSVR